MVVVKRAKNIKSDEFGSRGEKKFGFQNLEGGKPFLSTEIIRLLQFPSSQTISKMENSSFATIHHNLILVYTAKSTDELTVYI